MATVCHPRRVLVEIPAPQPKIAAPVRRSYLEVLSSQFSPSGPPTPRSRSPTITSRRGQSLEGLEGVAWTGRGEEHQSPVSKHQLEQLIRALIMVEQRQEPRTLTSDLKHLQEDLQLKKTNVYRSIPYSRLGSNRDAHCYRKAYPHLVAFKVSCQEWGHVLLRRKDWDAAVEHTLTAWRATSELPQWDTPAHNALRDQCYGSLASHCLTALQRLRPHTARAHDLLRRMKMAQLHSQAITPCIVQLERILTDGQESTMDTH